MNQVWPSIASALQSDRRQNRTSGSACRAIDGDRLASQRLHNEIGHHTAVARMHAWPIRVEDARDLDAQLVLALVVEEERLRATLAFVVTRASADGIDVAPIILTLRMHQRIAVHFARR